MEEQSPRIFVLAPVRVGLGVLAGAIALVLTLSMVMAQQAPDFDSSYKTGPPFADANDIVTYTIVAVNTGEMVPGVVLSDAVPLTSVFIPGNCTYGRESGPAQPCGPLSRLWEEDLATGDRITTTLAVQVGSGTMQYLLVNRAYLSWLASPTENAFTKKIPLAYKQKVAQQVRYTLELSHTTTVNPARLHLPLFVHTYSFVPGLQSEQTHWLGYFAERRP